MIVQDFVASVRLVAAVHAALLVAIDCFVSLVLAHHNDNDSESAPRWKNRAEVAI